MASSVRFLMSLLVLLHVQGVSSKQLKKPWPASHNYPPQAPHTAGQHVPHTAGQHGPHSDVESGARTASHRAPHTAGQSVAHTAGQNAAHGAGQRVPRAGGHAVPSKSQDSRHHRTVRSKAVRASLCRRQELTKQDSFFSPNTTTPANTKPQWNELFSKWANKKILLAGDSLMDQFFQVVACTAELMGGTTYLSNVMKFQWQDAKTTIANDTSEIPWGHVSGASSDNLNTQAVVYRLRIRQVPVGGEPISVTWVDYFRYYALTERCQKCGPGCGPVCAIDKSLVTKVDTLAAWVGKYDKAYINMGHDMGSADGSVMERKAELLSTALETSALLGRSVFMEHPAQHFPGSATGDWLHKLTHTACACDLPRIDDQMVAKNNRLLTNVSKRHGMSIAHIWGPFAKYGCDKQRPPDCTHYRISPHFWGPAAQIINAAS